MWSEAGDERDVKSVTVAVDGQETRLLFNEYSSFFSPYLAPVKPISHHRLRPDKTVLSGRVGVGGVNAIRNQA